MMIKIIESKKQLDELNAVKISIRHSDIDRSLLIFNSINRYWKFAICNINDKSFGNWYYPSELYNFYIDRFLAGIWHKFNKIF